MGERRGNRFYPHARLSASGTFAPEIGKLLEIVDGAVNRGHFAKTEIYQTFRCCELLFWKGSWDKVEEVASQVIATGVGSRSTLRLYRMWIEALRANYNFIGLKSLARHLLSLRHASEKFVPLAAMALSYTGERRFSSKILKTLNSRTSAKSILMIEACAVYQAESPRRALRERGLQYLQALNVKNQSNYFLARNYLIYALENDYLEEASKAFEMVHDRFPRCPEPFWGAARLALAQGHWSEAACVLQELVADHPDNVDALIALASCFEKNGDLLAARDILTSSSGLFDDGDYDYVAMLATVNRRLHQRYGMQEYRDEAVRYFTLAIQSAERIGISEAPLHVALNELGVRHQASSSASHAQEGLLRDADPLSASPKAWILSVDDQDVSHLKRYDSLLMRSPGAVKKGDIVLVARRFGSDDWRGAEQQVVAVMSAMSDVTPDSRYGFAVCVGRFQALENPLDLNLGKETTALVDFFGCENFSAQTPVFFLDADPGTSERVVRAVEHSLRQVFPNEASQHAI